MPAPGDNRMPTRPLPTASTLAATASTANRMRPATLPPYTSVRRLAVLERNWPIRWPLAPWISTPSNPAPTARTERARAGDWPV